MGIGIGLGLATTAALAWWWLTEPKPKNKLGHILCPVKPYTGRIELGDFVVIELQNKARTFSEPTWAQVTNVRGDQLSIRIIGETKSAGSPKPLMTSRHGWKIGDEMTIGKWCVFDRLRPGQQWTVLCGPHLTGTGFAPIAANQASLLGVGDDAVVVVRGDDGGTEGLWVRITSVSAGHQTISGTVMGQPTLTDHGVAQGDVLEFLRDCVVDAAFN